MEDATNIFVDGVGGWVGGHPFWFGRELNIFVGTVVARCVKWLPRGEEGGGLNGV